MNMLRIQYNIVEYLDDNIDNLKDKIEILIEPGTALASRALDFVARVVSIKKINDTFYVNTTGSKYNMNPSHTRIDSPLQILNFNSQKFTISKNAKLCGYTCIESDIIHNNFNDNIAVGDLIIFKEVGSYSVVMKPPFILPDVAIIRFNNDRNEFEIIRYKQTFEDVL